MGEVTKRMGSVRKIVRSYNGIFLFLMVLLFFIYSFFFGIESYVGFTLKILNFLKFESE